MDSKYNVVEMNMIRSLFWHPCTKLLLLKPHSNHYISSFQEKEVANRSKSIGHVFGKQLTQIIREWNKGTKDLAKVSDTDIINGYVQ